MPNFIRVNRDKIQHLKHFIRNDCIPLHNGPKEGSWSCVSCVHDNIELTVASCAGEGQPCRWCSIVDHLCKCSRPWYVPIQTGPPFDKRQNDIHWRLVFKAKGDETRATGNTRRNGKTTRAKGVSLQNTSGVPPVNLAQIVWKTFMIISRKIFWEEGKGKRKFLFFN